MASAPTSGSSSSPTSTASPKFLESPVLGVLFVLSGPSGVGKGTVAASLLDREPALWLSRSSTTRPARPGEVDGREYHFVDRETFEKWRLTDEFVEWAEVYGQYYGTPRRPLEEHLAEGGDVLLEIDLQGALSIRAAYPRAVLVFLAPPSRAAQHERLVGRDGDSAEAIAARLAAAEAEEAMADRFDHVVVNDDLERAVAAVAAILETHRQR